MIGYLFLFSCPAWTRTRDYSINSRVFYQLNYGTICSYFRNIMKVAILIPRIHRNQTTRLLIKTINLIEAVNLRDSFVLF